MKNLLAEFLALDNNELVDAGALIAEGRFGFQCSGLDAALPPRVNADSQNGLFRFRPHRHNQLGFSHEVTKDNSKKGGGQEKEQTRDFGSQPKVVRFSE
jgi:hypothetical protein